MRVASSFQGPFPTTDKEAFAASFDMPINQCAKLWKIFQITYFFSKSFRQKAFFYHFSKLKPLLGIFIKKKRSSFPRKTRVTRKSRKSRKSREI